MPSYSSPTVVYVRLLTGLSTEVEDLFETELSDRITDLLPSAEAELSHLITAATFGSASLTAAQVTTMQDYVAYKVGERLYSVFVGVVGQNAQHPVQIQPELMTEGRTYCGRRARVLLLSLLGTESIGNNYLARARLEPGA